MPNHETLTGDKTPGVRLSTGRAIGLLLGPLTTLILLLVPAPEAMPPQAWRMVAMSAWIIIWWISEAVSISATALLPLVLMPLLGLQEIKPTAANYAHPLIFLFLGGFMLAAAMQRAGLHRRIALHIVSAVGTTPSRIVFGFMLATAFLSMWISNTATTIMMFAVGLSVIELISERSKDPATARHFGVALMLAIAYSASIGGVATLIGTPPNALLASFLQNNYNIEVSFAGWMLLGVPIALVMLPLAWLLLTRVLFPAESIAIEDPEGLVEKQLITLGAMSRAERLVAMVFVGAAAAWILRTPLARLTGLPIDDSVIAIIAALLLFAIPVSTRRAEFALDWQTACGLPWGILLLFGGGLALAGGFTATGLAEWIGNSVAGLEVSTLILVLIISTAIVYLTEITSNTASTATFLPILGAVAVGLSLAPAVLTVPVALAASMAFMMPVATPPNAIVFAYQELTLADMVHAGMVLNLIAIGVSFGLFWLIGPVVFGFEW